MHFHVLFILYDILWLRGVTDGIDGILCGVFCGYRTAAVSEELKKRKVMFSR